MHFIEDIVWGQFIVTKCTQLLRPTVELVGVEGAHRVWSTPLRGLWNYNMALHIHPSMRPSSRIVVGMEMHLFVQ